mgnify:CR=1 FL=1
MAKTTELLKKIEAKYFEKNPNRRKRNNAFSQDWFRKYASKNFSRIRTSQMMRDKEWFKSRPIPGKMYMYVYDAKYKDELPYWDAFPLVFVLDDKYGKNNNILGLNLHYLPPALRLVVFRQMLKYRNEKRYRKSTRLKLEWQALKSLSTHHLFKAMIHQYKKDHLRSRLVEVPAEMWEIVISLPTARFQKASNKTVWSEARKKK